jgi:ankyrin repeat protein
LLDYGADVTVSDKTGKTPLMYASWAGRTDTVKLLLSYGADPDASDENGNNASDYASREGHNDVLNLLESEKLWREE